MAAKAKWGPSYKGRPSIFDWDGVGANGVKDDIVPALAYAEECAKNGYDFELEYPHRFTAPLKFGPTIYPDLSTVVGRTTPLNDTAHSSIWNATNRTASRAYAGCNIRGRSGAVIIADFTGSNTPVIEYNAWPLAIAHTVSGQLPICAPAHIDSNKRPGESATIPANGLIGWLQSQGGMMQISGLSFHGMEAAGFLATQAYGLHAYSMRAWGCGQAFSLDGFNAGRAHSLQAFYSTYGTVWNGDNCFVSPETQQCETDVWMMAADDSVLETQYLEDVSATDGTGKYMLKLGYAQDTASIYHSKFRNIRCGSARPNKGAIRSWGVHGSCSFENVRTYSKATVKDTIGPGVLVGATNDFTWS